MNFKDHDIEQLDLNQVEDFVKLILYYLCGVKFPLEDLEKDKIELLESIIKEINCNNLNYEQFNEILLLFKQDRITENFFDYIFSGEIRNLEKLKEGIVRFRGLSILNFGDFRFTYKKFSKMTIDEINQYFHECDISKDELEKSFGERPKPIIDLKLIDKEKTWYLGYLSSTLIKKESDHLEKLLKECGDPESYEPLSKNLLIFDTELKENRKKGKFNTNTYLIWDYIDVYIATSMRKKIEFVETNEIIEKIFTNPKIIKLNLRYFDPTQSYCELTRNKGLIEGLMLKRARCTVYMIQESDTFGKDSELAATLAQKKPVIAFIPAYEKDILCEKIKNYPLDYIKERIFNFKAEGVFDEIEILKDLDKDSLELNKILDTFLQEYEVYRLKQHFSLWREKEEQFKNKNVHFQEVCEILAIYTKKYWDKRAKTLQEDHPLGMQIDLNSGVANGVLVVRNIENCVKILEEILTNSLNFEIKHHKDGYTGLTESNSKSIYRIVTDDELLTNSFWNFFYKI